MQAYVKILCIIFLPFCAHCFAAPSDSNFQTYWSTFRAASLSNDYATLEKLIQFPLEVKGVDDSDPVETYPKDQLRNIFPKLMKQSLAQYDGTDKFINVTFAELIKKIDKVDTTAGDTYVRVEQFEFELINSKWYLVSAYLEE